MALERDIEQLTANAIAKGGSATDLATGLQDAISSRNSWKPPFDAAELCVLGRRDDLLGRIARGLTRADAVALKHGRSSLIAPASKRSLPDDIDAENLLIQICGALTHRPHEWVLF